MKIIFSRRFRQIVFVLLVVLSFGWITKMTLMFVRWKGNIWIIPYLTSSSSESSQGPKHVIFITADHFEPGKGLEGVRRAEQWLERFRPIAERHHDAFGNRFRYTWFYPYDHKNDGVVTALNEFVFQGFGEIEMHWHLPHEANSENFPAMLDEAIKWFQ